MSECNDESCCGTYSNQETKIPTEAELSAVVLMTKLLIPTEPIPDTFRGCTEAIDRVKAAIDKQHGEMQEAAFYLSSYMGIKLVAADWMPEGVIDILDGRGNVIQRMKI